MRERKRYLEQEQAANLEVERQVAAMEKQAARARLDVASSETQLQQLIDEVGARITHPSFAWPRC